MNTEDIIFQKAQEIAYRTVKLPEVMARDPAELLELDWHLYPS